MIPLGILGNRRGGAAAGAYELISTAYGTGSSGTLTFSSIPSTYKHLQIRYTAKTTWAAVAIGSIRMRFNSDTASNYNYHRLYGNGSSVLSDSDGGSITEIDQFIVDAGASGNDSMFGAGVIDILDYASISKNKTVRGLTGVKNSSQRLALSSGLWRSTTAISSVTLLVSAGNFTTASRFSLYGIKG